MPASAAVTYAGVSADNIIIIGSGNKYTALRITEVFGVAAGYSSYRDAIAFTILVFVLMVKPTGLLGKKIQTKV